MSKTWGSFSGGSGHGPEPPEISAYYNFFPGKSYFYRTTRPGKPVFEISRKL